ncbi:MAG: hypothetical protein ACTIC1_03945, partial [Brevibacterium sp.]
TTYDRLRDHDEHAGILDAVKRGDGFEASHRTRRHLEAIKAAVLADWQPEAEVSGGHSGATDDANRTTTSAGDLR